MPQLIFSHWEDGSTNPSRVLSGSNQNCKATYVLATGTLHVDTAPVKGEIFVNGVSWGNAPQSRTVETGSYIVSFGNVTGYISPQSMTAVVTVNTQTDVMGAYVPIPPPEKGTLIIYTTPVNGEVFVNGQSWGIAPQSQIVDPGEYMVSYGSVEGYTSPSTQTATVNSDQITSVLGIYNRLPQGTLRVDTAPVKGEVFVNGTSWGIAPQSRIISPGHYIVSFGASSGYLTPESRTVTVEQDMETSITGLYLPILPTQGALDVSATVDGNPVEATVEVVGVGIDVTPFKIAVNPGTYILNATYNQPLLPNIRNRLYQFIPGIYDRLDKYQAQTQTTMVEVQAGQTILVIFQFTSER